MNKIAIISNFLAFFCFYLNNFPSWNILNILNADQDPGGKMNADPCGSGMSYSGSSLEFSEFRIQAKVPGEPTYTY